MEREREINPDQALNKIYYVLEKTKERKERQVGTRIRTSIRLDSIAPTKSHQNKLNQRKKERNQFFGLKMDG